MKFFLSCEHGGNQVPDQYTHLFLGVDEVLGSHRGWDIGALDLFYSMMNTQVHFSLSQDITRLLVDVNRSLNRRSLFSEYLDSYSESEKKEILDKFYFPFRRRFLWAVSEVIKKGDEVFHVSVHSFTPELKGLVRNTDIGILYDPRHGCEKALAVRWKKILKEKLPGLRIRFNYPYTGKNDGHVAPLRKQFGPSYAGIELEMNNMHSVNEEVMKLISQSYSDLCNLINKK